MATTVNEYQNYQASITFTAKLFYSSIGDLRDQQGVTWTVPDSALTMYDANPLRYPLCSAWRNNLDSGVWYLGREMHENLGLGPKAQSLYLLFRDSIPGYDTENTGSPQPQIRANSGVYSTTPTVVANYMQNLVARIISPSVDDDKNEFNDDAATLERVFKSTLDPSTAFTISQLENGGAGTLGGAITSTFTTSDENVELLADIVFMRPYYDMLKSNDNSFTAEFANDVRNGNIDTLVSRELFRWLSRFIDGMGFEDLDLLNESVIYGVPNLKTTAATGSAIENVATPDLPMPVFPKKKGLPPPPDADETKNDKKPPPDDDDTTTTAVSSYILSPTLYVFAISAVVVVISLFRRYTRSRCDIRRIVEAEDGTLYLTTS